MAWSVLSSLGMYRSYSWFVSPFTNFRKVPDKMQIGKSAPALIAGNTVVVKSSEKAPLTVS
jgi:acyl-CoA reductase-like NAD-dependent aldehyde dehydrogenase